MTMVIEIGVIYLRTSNLSSFKQKNRFAIAHFSEIHPNLNFRLLVSTTTECSYEYTRATPVHIQTLEGQYDVC